MDYEKVYKESLDRAKQVALTEEHKSAAEYIFPELAESEDERIRKELISIVENWKEYNSNFPFADEPIYVDNVARCDSILAWLEKQKDINCLACDQHLKGYVAGRKATEEERQKEQKPSEWSEEDEKMLDSILCDVATADKHYGGTGTYIEKRKWLKSLRPTWKPSDEQMKELLFAEKIIRNEDFDKTAAIIGDLYNELKQL